jgi:pimeloyl-ACP methyl ester carboxylesterase
VFVQGSGCVSVFSERDGMQNLLQAAAKGRCRVLVVEKPGVKFGVVPRNFGSSEEGSAEFRREQTLPRWVEAVNAAVLAAHRLEDVDWTRTLVVGHSEGGIVAAHVAAANPLVEALSTLPGQGVAADGSGTHRLAGDRLPISRARPRRRAIRRCGRAPYAPADIASLKAR